MRCRKAMWYGDGSPAGHCDEPAYGATRFGWDGMPLQIACERHGGPVLDLRKDGNKWCATVRPYDVTGCDAKSGRAAPQRAGFADLQNSPAGFGHTKKQAVTNLTRQLNDLYKPTQVSRFKRPSAVFVVDATRS